jgi:hypothetical protein
VTPTVFLILCGPDKMLGGPGPARGP